MGYCIQFSAYDRNESSKNVALNEEGEKKECLSRLTSLDQTFRDPDKSLDHDEWHKSEPRLAFRLEL